MTNKLTTPINLFSLWHFAFLLLSLNLLLFACKENKDTLPAPLYLLESPLISDFSETSLENFLINNPNVSVSPDLIRLLVVGGARVHKIVYKTTNADGTEIQASGALVIPKFNNPSSPFLSIQHGTITSQRDAPSNFDRSTEATFFASLFGGTGYVVAVPDYIGYGASKNLPHPYEHRATLASASLDMLRASREFCERNGIILNEKLFLTGYSEGGFATMSLHKLIEEKYSEEFMVTASAPGAGAYHKTAFGEYIVQANQELTFLNSYLWVLDTYNKVYALNRPWSFYLTEANATIVNTEGFFSENIQYNPQQLFTQTLRNGILNKTDTPLLNAFADNDIYDWKPKAVVKLFHGDRDDFVPFFNSQNTFNAMKARGANVSLEVIQGGDHFSSQEPYANAVFNFFAGLR